MNQIDRIMALHHEAAEAAVDYVVRQMEPWHQQAALDASKRHMESTRQALRTAIEQAINACGPGAGCLHKVARIEALEQELATIKESLTVQEPVAWMTHAHEPLPMFHRTYAAAKDWGANPMPLYTSPQPQREWVGLTEDEIWEVIRPLCVTDRVCTILITIGIAEYRAIEAKLKEKNGGGV
jgi:hypothetical protein